MQCRFGWSRHACHHHSLSPWDEHAGLREAFVIVDEYDALRDDGEAYAHKLTAAGLRCTCVRYNGTIHDFMMLNALREAAAATARLPKPSTCCTWR